MVPKEHLISGFIALVLFCSMSWGTTSTAATENRGLQSRGATIVCGYLPQVFYNVDPRDVAGLMEAWSRLIEHKIKGNFKASFIVFKNIEGAEKALANNEVDVLVMIPEEFIRLRANFRLVPLLSADNGDRFYNDLVLLVREDSGITRIGQLRGKNLYIDVGQQGSIPIKWLDTLLRARLSTNAQGVFNNIKEFNKASQVVLPVFFHQADACLVSRNHFETLVELNPQLGRQLRVLETSPGFVTGILAVRKDLQSSKRDAIVKSSLEMHNDPKGKQIMTVFRINRMVPFKDEHLASIEKVLREHRGETDGVAKKRH
ncbi:MAG: PhnD/SsuA/transferrin family substrate-binding protein [Desulfuromonadales bacterium]|nr:PhnD/SsuA/transferrin family substrate-binding protein [Desulfuromonadales bacterium]